MRLLLLNIAGHTDLGWAPRAETQAALINGIAQTGVDTSLAEARDTRELEALLAELPPATLIWPNAYFIPESSPDGPLRWLAEILEEHRLPFIGSPAPALQAMIHKDDCQRRLMAAGLPIPRFLSLNEDSFAGGMSGTRLATTLAQAGLSWPLVIKPASTAGSHGIARVTSLDELMEQIESIRGQYGSRMLIEEYLPGHDVTIGVLNFHGELALLPTWYEFEGLTTGVLDFAVRQAPWAGPKRMRRVTEPEVLAQIEEVIPQVVDVLGMRDGTRVDGRLDAQGKLRLFDVNGMPCLESPNSVLVHQAVTFWEESDPEVAVDLLLAALTASAAERQGLTAPPALLAQASRAARRCRPAARAMPLAAGASL
ncbi:MAG: hypothetical protein SX243_21940 [Acidobacteriota bacterium]|nr:hypothetical protein [Acidobacteriota bacterium]